jgi:TolB-like protein
VAEHVVDGLTDDLIAAISAWRVFPVISRSTAFVHRGSTADPRLLGRQLGARYIVAGSLRGRAGQLRVQAELTDVESGAVLLATHFDRPAGGIEAMQDELVLAICGVLAPELHRQERERAARRPRADASAQDLVHRGQWHRLRGGRDDHAAAEALFAEVLAGDPAHARALAALSIARNYAAIRRWTDDVPAAFRESLDLARRARQADPRDPQGQYAFGLALMNLGRREDAMEALRLATDLNPSLTAARANLGQLLNYLNRPEEALAELNLALRLSPQDPYLFQWLPYVAASHYLAGRYRDSLAASEQALLLAPEYPLAVRYLVASLGQLGQAQAAAAALPLMRRIDGDPTRLEAMARRLFVPEAAAHIMEGFRKAGFG